MLYFECPYPVLEKRILGRAKYSGRKDDNIESLKQRFDTFKSVTLPTVELFRKSDRCVDLDTSRDRETVYRMVVKHLAEHTEDAWTSRPLSEHSEVLLGLRPRPK